MLQPFRVRAQVDRSAAEKLWAVLSEAIDEIHNRNASQLSFEELYRSAYNLVIQKHGSFLYEGTKEKLTSHLRTASERLSQTPESTLLEEVAASYREHVTTMTMVRDILMYMDRTYVQQQRTRPTYELGLHLYRVSVWGEEEVKNRVSELLLQSIASERAGYVLDDRSLIKANLTMLQQLGSADGSNVYERDFEGSFLANTQEFYRNESSSFLAENSASDYVLKAERRLEEEKLRAAALSLPPTTEGPLRQILEVELIQRHAKTLVLMDNSGFDVLLQDESKIDEMKKMYDLFFRASTSVVDCLRDAFCERVKLDGKALISDQDKGDITPSTFIRGLLKMREKYMYIADYAFRGEKKVLKRLKESFEDFLNVDTRAASCLAMYSDELLKSGLKGASDEEVTLQVNKVILIFRYLSDKDVFEAFYKQHLARRLLTGRSVSDEVEKEMVAQLKHECGYQFTSKLEGMFNDMRISKDIRDTYQTHKRSQPPPQKDTGNGRPIDIEVDVLTAGHWPSHKVPDCNLPSAIQDSIDHFTDFYLKKHTGRKLSWQTSTGSVEMQAAFGKNSYRLCVSTYQMCILMLFNGTQKLTLGRIKSETNIPELELKRHLISLCTPKHRILRKGSKGKHISGDDDTFTINSGYKSQFKRVKIPLVSIKEAKSGSAKDDGSGVKDAGANSKLPPLVEEERRHLVEAAIVRIMKTRKTLKHNDLIAEVTKQLSVRFVASPQFIKKRIEGLIERDYLERSEYDHRLYQYVA